MNAVFYKNSAMADIITSGLITSFEYFYFALNNGAKVKLVLDMDPTVYKKFKEVVNARYNLFNNWEDHVITNNPKMFSFKKIFFASISSYSAYFNIKLRNKNTELILLNIYENEVKDNTTSFGKGYFIKYLFSNFKNNPSKDSALVSPPVTSSGEELPITDEIINELKSNYPILANKKIIPLSCYCDPQLMSSYDTLVIYDNPEKPFVSPRIVAESFFLKKEVILYKVNSNCDSLLIKHKIDQQGIESLQLTTQDPIISALVG